MNREEIIRIAREAGIPETETEGVFIANSDDFGRFAAMVAEKERKECMDLCMSIEQTEPLTDRVGWEHGTVDCACAISRRGSNV